MLRITCCLISIALLCAPSSVAAQEIERWTWHSEVHVFSLDDVLGDLDGTTALDDPTILCRTPTCTGADPYFDDRLGVMLYPIDNAFGYDVKDFVGGTHRDRDGVYSEGFIGEVIDEPVIGPGGVPEYLNGVVISNIETSTLKTGAPVGTWCAGMGGDSVKCSTEKYTVLEHVLTCSESVPYFYQDPWTGLPVDPTVPCKPLALIPHDDYPTVPNESSVVCDAPPDADGIRRCDDLVIGPDYSVTLKDDGKPLYRWGTMLKRPTDVRLYAAIDLPVKWLEKAEFRILRAELWVRHRVTNNPNDQLRPEDYENEAATGLLPDVWEDADGLWFSKKDCYEADGDVIPAGSVLRNPPFADPTAPSSDIRSGLTNAWYTTLDRDPFEWSYRTAAGDLVGSPLPDPSLGALESGPRWRLRSGKFGQNVPHLDIPAIACSEPPYEHDNLKYPVGELTTTVLNLLDWNGTSPLVWSSGWLAPQNNPAVASDRCERYVAGVCISAEGVPLTDAFDLALYVKGDKKPLALYDAQLVIEYEAERELGF